MRTISLEQFQSELKAQGVPGHEHCAFKCPICGTVQSGSDLMAATGKPFDEIEKYLAFSCIGRFTNAGPWRKGDKPGNGCDWTLGGLFTLHKLEVEVGGVKHPRFELATPDEAQVHATRVKAKHPVRA